MALPQGSCLVMLDALLGYSHVPIPVRDLPEIVVPTALMQDHAVLDPDRKLAIDLRQNIAVGNDEVVELDEHRRALHRIEFLLGLVKDVVILLALPARDV